MQRVRSVGARGAGAKKLGVVALLAAMVVGPASLAAADEKDAEAKPKYERVEDVIYGRKWGMALTLDVFRPAEPNGAALVFCVSGGWFSSHDAVSLPFAEEFLKRGYTVFQVVHGSQPKFTIPEVVEDMHRAVRYIRHHADDYGIDPERIGIYGMSAGGHLSLMLGTSGRQGDPKAKDPVDRESSRVQAVVAFCPPTDFLNYGQPDENALGRGVLAGFKAPFDFHEFNPQNNSFVPITDEERVLEIGRQISPVTHVTSDDAPTWIIHGDADKLVPIQQAELIVEKLKAAGVPAKLVVKEGAAHGWPHLMDDTVPAADWFDKHLAQPSAGE